MTSPVSGTDPTSGGDAEPEGRPPGGTWNRAYALVIGVLAADVALLWLVGQIYK